MKVLYAQDQGWDQIEVDKKESNISWNATQGEKNYTGLAPVLNGFIFLEKDELKGGTLFIDMNNITINNLESKEDYVKMMEFMQGPEFFNVRKNPFAVCKIYNVSKTTGGNFTHVLKASLTIKGRTHQFEVPVVMNISKEDIQIKGESPMDRKNWSLNGYHKKEVKEEDVIQDEFKISFQIKAPRKS